jgi:flagellin-specific chaperone FliS
MQGDDLYLSFLKAQDALTSTEGVIESLEKVAKFLGEEGWHAKATYVDRAIDKIKELDRKLNDE